MSNSTFSYDQLEKRFYEIFSLQPTDLGSRRLTALYKIITKRLKTMPFLYVIPLVSIIAVVSYLLLGHLLVKLASLLQYGF